MTDLQSNVEKAWDAKRPLFHRLSEGTCWLVSFPYTSPAQAEGRLWYHFMLDSWVWGEVGMLGGWAVGQSFKNEPKYSSYADVEGVCREIETITHRIQGITHTGPAATLDAVVISHFSIDHIAPIVLRSIPPTTPVFASSLAYSSIIKLGHFDTVIEFGTYDPSNWKASQVDLLPPWLSFGLLNPAADIAHQTPAVIIAFEHDKTVKAIVYALHGIHPKELAPIIDNGQVEVLGSMCGLTATKTITGHLIAYGGPEALACVRALKPRWWIKNHDDEHVNVYGLIGRALRMDEYTLDRLLKEEAGDGDVRGLEGTELVDLRQGESIAMVA